MLPEPESHLALEFRDSSSKLDMRGGESSQRDERPHDLDVDAHGLLAPQNARQHRDTLFGECVRTRTPPAVTRT